MPEGIPLLEMVGISKRFGATVALNNVSFDLRSSEVHCLVGENGAGKSTLMKILSGGYQADDGQILLNGIPIKIGSPLDGLRQGIGVVYQELELLPDLTVAENIMMGVKGSSRFGMMKWGSIYKRANFIVNDAGMNIDTKRYVSELTVAEAQLVAIAKVLALEPKILVLDEPSAVLAGRELDQLFQLIARLKQQGIGVIYISHRMEEMFRIGDRITVLRDGELIETMSVGSVSETRLIELMVGRRVENRFPERAPDYGEKVLLRLERLSTGGLCNISFEVHQGEIFGIAGLVGSGQNELAQAIYGLQQVTSGHIEIDGKKVEKFSPRRALALGVALVPEERKTQGLVLMHSVFENLTYSILKQSTRRGILDFKRLHSVSAHFQKSLSIKTPTLLHPVGNLSGGNQQKVVMAKALATSPKVLILDEPTRGVDVGAKAEFYQLIASLARSGHAIVLISAELVELIGLSHRIAVMSEGTVRKIVEPPFDEQEILRYALPLSSGYNGEEKEEAV